MPADLSLGWMVGCAFCAAVLIVPLHPTVGLAATDTWRYCSCTTVSFSCLVGGFEPQQQPAAAGLLRRACPSWFVLAGVHSGQSCCAALPAAGSDMGGTACPSHSLHHIGTACLGTAPGCLKRCWHCASGHQSVSASCTCGLQGVLNASCRPH